MSVITVELKSDLCAGTGTGFSSFVDTDISYDRYIPGRRLKGCLREAAEYYYGKDHGEIARVFGTAGGQEEALGTGGGRMGVFKISNGYLEEIRNMFILANGYLEDIYKYSKQIYTDFSEKLDEIATNTK